MGDGDARGLSATAYAPYGSPQDYILGWTSHIWEERAVGRIRDHYSSDVVVHSAYGTRPGVEPVVSGTLQKIAAYPDRSSVGEDVIWEPRGRTGFISSHRVISSGTNTGHSAYGAPTNRRFTYRAIAHCLIHQARLVEEWLVRDEWAVVEQLGLDPLVVAAQIAATSAGTPAPTLRPVDLPPARTGVSGERPAEPVDAAEPRALEVVEATFAAWQERTLHELVDLVAADVVCHTTRGRTVQGAAGYRDEVVSLLARFPDARVRLVDLAVRADGPAGLRVAAVWWLTGTYGGIPVYGPPNDAPVAVLGASHFRLLDGRVREEWRIFDEVAVAAQVAAGPARPAPAPPAAGGPAGGQAP